MHAMTDALWDLFRARDFHRKLLKLGLPMALSAILSSSLQILDTLMIAQLGDVPVAAVGLANRLTYLMSFFTAGISSGAAIFAASAAGSGSGGFDSVREAAARMASPVKTVYRPDPASARVYDALYDEYRLLHDTFGRGGSDVMYVLGEIEALLQKSNASAHTTRLRDGRT